VGENSAIAFSTAGSQSLFFESSSKRIPFSLAPYSWLPHSPIYIQALASHRLPPAVLSLLDRPDVSFILHESWLLPLQTFYREHHGLHIHLEPLVETDELPGLTDCRLHLYKAQSERLDVSRRLLWIQRSAVDRAIGVLKLETGRNSSSDDQLPAVLCPVVRRTKKDEGILVVVSALGTRHDVVDVDERRVTTSRNDAPSSVAPHDLASNRRWDVLMST